MARNIKILGLQFRPKLGDKIYNYQQVSRLMKENADFEADIVILPEVFNTGLDCKSFHALAETIPDSTTMFLAGFAEKYSTNIVGGSFIEKTFDDDYKNTTAVFDRTGKIIAKYSKIHTFSGSERRLKDEGGEPSAETPLNASFQDSGSERRLKDEGGEPSAETPLNASFQCCESDFIAQGNKAVLVDTDVAKLGLSICYDLRFPELYRALTYNGAEILICVAAWPEIRKNQLVTLAKARAIENQCFVVLVNQTGKLTLSTTNAGCSMVISPRGEVIAELGSEEGVLKAEITLDDMYNLRKEFPVLEDRNLNAYNV